MYLRPEQSPATRRCACFQFFIYFAPDPQTEGSLRAYQIRILGTNLDDVGAFKALPALDFWVPDFLAFMTFHEGAFHDRPYPNLGGLDRQVEWRFRNYPIRFFCDLETCHVRFFRASLAEGGLPGLFFCLRAGGEGGPWAPPDPNFWALWHLAEGGLRVPLSQGAPDILSECPPTLMKALVTLAYRV